MKILVDASVWSLAFRRRAPAHPSVDELRRLITAGRAAIIGPIRQEVLSGIRDTKMFERLPDRLSAFPDETVTAEDSEQAADFFNTCPGGTPGIEHGLPALRRLSPPRHPAPDDQRGLLTLCTGGSCRASPVRRVTTSTGSRVTGRSNRTSRRRGTRVSWPA